MNERISIADKKPEAKSQNPIPRIRRKTESFQSMNSPVDRILYLQRTIGNRAVGKLMKSGALQAKLRIGQPGDIYEQEADRVAEQVMRMPDVSSGKDTTIQRKCSKCLKGLRGLLGKDKKDEKLQAKETPSKTPKVTSQIEANNNTLREGGQPLPESIRAFFEPRFGQDFSQVRMHTDAKAAQSARAVNARAFTVGQNVVFGEGEYAPGMSEGRKLLVHELAHVVQQTSGGIMDRGADGLNLRRLPVLLNQHAGSIQRQGGDGAKVRARCGPGGLGCDLTINCGDKVCALTDCGKGSCSWCPPGLGNLIIKGWCAYSCLPTGTAFVLISRIGNWKFMKTCLD